MTAPLADADLLPLLDTIEQKATKATEGPWFESCPAGVNWRVRNASGAFVIEQHQGPPVRWQKDAEYIAACSPDVLLRLIAAYKELRSDSEALVKAIDAAIPSMAAAAVLAHVHGVRQSGPTFGEEWKALARRLGVTPEHVTLEAERDQRRAARPDGDGR